MILHGVDRKVFCQLRIMTVKVKKLKFYLLCKINNELDSSSMSCLSDSDIFRSSPDFNFYRDRSII